MLRPMTADVTVKTVEPASTAVVAAATTWAEFPAMWGPMLDQVWSFLRGGAPAGLYMQGHNIMLYKDDVPNVEVGVQVSGSFEPVGHVVPSTLPGGLVATATHTGPIATIGDTHQAVCEWSKANEYRLARPSLGDLRRSRPIERPFRRAGVLVAGGAVTGGRGVALPNRYRASTPCRPRPGVSRCQGDSPSLAGGSRAGTARAVVGGRRICPADPDFGSATNWHQLAYGTCPRSGDQP